MRTRSENDFAAWLGQENSTKECSDINVENTRMINSMIKKNGKYLEPH